MQSKVYVIRRGAIDSDRSVSVAGRSSKVWHNCDDHPPVAEIQCFGILHAANCDIDTYLFKVYTLDKVFANRANIAGCF